MQDVTALAAAVGALSAKLAHLEAKPASCAGDWVRLDAAVTSAALHARSQLCDATLDERDLDTLFELLDELRYIKLCAQRRMCDLECNRG